jgi:aryl-alcohol dehydrogenase-like predicted oxidoreductase
MGRLGRRESLRALHAAFDVGVNYFDVARAYGYGQAEFLLGEFLTGRRDDVVVATKFGILPPRPNLLRTVARPVVRGAMRLTARTGLSAADRVLRRGIARGAGLSPQRGYFTPALARESLHTSLRALRRDRVDLLWLHECSPTDLTDELRSTLDRFVSDGTVGQYGPATDPESCRMLLTVHPHIPIAQLPHNVLSDGLSASGGRPVVTHSIFGSPEDRSRLRVAMDRDVTRDRDPDRFALKYALAVNRTGVVILGMSDPRHIAVNAAIASEPPDESALVWAEKYRSLAVA